MIDVQPPTEGKVNFTDRDNLGSVPRFHLGNPKLIVNIISFVVRGQESNSIGDRIE